MINLNVDTVREGKDVDSIVTVINEILLQTHNNLTKISINASDRKINKALRTLGFTNNQSMLIQNQLNATRGQW